MDVPQKIRFLNRFQAVFPEWTFKRKALTIEEAFDDDLAAAKDAEARHVVLQQRAFEADEYWNALAERRSRHLENQARKLYLSVDGLEWQIDSYANRYLDSASQSKLHRAIIEERRKIWGFRLKVIGALTGLVGAAIGLLAFLDKLLSHGRH